MSPTSSRVLWPYVGLAGSTHRRLPLSQTRPIRTLTCGPGCAAMPPNTRVMGSGAAGGGGLAAQAGGGVVDPADRGRRRECAVGDRLSVDSTVDGKAVKIVSMFDEHTRCSLLNIVERSVTAERLVIELECVFAAAGGPPKVLRMDNGAELVSQALQRCCEGKVGLSYIPPGTPWNNGYIESNTSTIIDTAIRPWAAERRPSTPRRAGTLTPGWPARSTESGTKQTRL